MTAAALPRPVRVAIYTRKSVTDGLDQEFNSLDAQRQAIEAYVQSQAGLGWTALANRYDDGGFSGATTDRPAFQALLADVEQGHIDVVAVYKIDRLSRSLRDFAQLIDSFEKNAVTFVSVTQQFSTANSMGRLTLNILMSFAEFEREVTSERIRDKVRATRRRGAWTGGRPVLGYDVLDKKLVVNADEALQVQATYRLYLERGTLRATVEELRRRGWTNKSFRSRAGREVGGGTFTSTSLHALLTNPLYSGQMRCGADLVPGEHEAIVDADLWDAVQTRMRSNGHKGGAKARNKAGALLRGMLRCGRCGSAMTHSFTTRGTRRHRYYVCTRAHREGAATCSGARVAAGPFEKLIVDQVRVMGTDEGLMARTATAVKQLTARQHEQLQAEQRRLEMQFRAQGDGDGRRQVARRLTEVRVELEVVRKGPVNCGRLQAALSAFNPIWDELFPAEQERILRLLIERVTYDPDTKDVGIELRPCGIEALAEEAEVAT